MKMKALQSPRHVEKNVERLNKITSHSEFEKAMEGGGEKGQGEQKGRKVI